MEEETTTQTQTQEFNEAYIIERVKAVLPNWLKNLTDDDVKQIIREYLDEKQYTRFDDEDFVKNVVRRYMLESGYSHIPLGFEGAYYSKDGKRSQWSRIGGGDGGDVTPGEITPVGDYDGDSEDPDAEPLIRGTHRWGYRIAKNVSDPSGRVEYLYDAVGKASAFMINVNGSISGFDYGDWGDMWFITGNKPCMLKYDGTVDYYLNPDSYMYEYKEGTSEASDYNNVYYAGNAMASIPLVWVCRYEDEDYYYEIISDKQYNKSYHAYAHTQADGSIADVFYVGMFNSFEYGSRARSLYSTEHLRSKSRTPNSVRGMARANGGSYDVMSWSQKELLRTLLTLMTGSVNFFATLGRCFSNPSSYGSYGQISDGGFARYNYSSSSPTAYVRLFHIQCLYGMCGMLLVGLLEKKHKYYVKMTPINGGYSLFSTKGYDCLEDGHQDYDEILPADSPRKYIKQMTCSKYGMLFKSGSAAVQESDTEELKQKDFCSTYEGIGVSDESYSDDKIYCAQCSGDEYVHNGNNQGYIIYDSLFSMQFCLTADDTSEETYGSTHDLGCIITCFPPLPAIEDNTQ